MTPEQFELWAESIQAENEAREQLEEIRQSIIEEDREAYRKPYEYEIDFNH